MNKYIKALYLSLFSRRFYIETVSRQNFSGYLYILLISLIISVPSSMQVKSNLQEVFDYDSAVISAEKYLGKLNTQLPKIYYENNKFIFDVKKLTFVNIGEANSFMVIDPNSEITNFSEFPDTIILKEDKLIYNYKNQELQVFTPDKLFESFAPYFLKGDVGNTFNSQKFFQDLSYFINFSYAILFVLILVITAVKYLIWVFLFSNVAYIIALYKLKPFILPNKTLFKICCLALTPVALFDLARIITDTKDLFLYPVIISMTINVFYINYIIDSFKLTITNKV